MSRHRGAAHAETSVSKLARRGRQVKDAFLLKRAETVARNLTPARQATIRKLYRAAMVRIALADQTTDARYAAATVALHRESVRFLISAVLLAQNATLPGVPLELRAGADKLEELVQAQALPALPNCYAEAMSILDAPDLCGPGSSPPETGGTRPRHRRNAGAWLRAQVEPRSLLRIRVTRALRLVLAGAAVLGLIAWGLVSIPAPKNLPCRSGSR